MMTYTSAIQFLDSFINFEQIKNFNPNRCFNLERMRLFLSWFEAPQNNYPSVLIAGTKGKGSTAAFLTSILKESGYKVGTYISPHLQHERERIQINQQHISEKEFVLGVELIKKKFQNKKIPKELGRPTYYELFTLLTFILFKKKKVDIAVIEVGMGGRLDATNVLEPLCSVITSISLDHQDQLGNTVAKIAKEKADIFRTGKLAVSAEQDKEAMKQIRFIAKQKKSFLFEDKIDFSVSLKKMSSQGLEFTFSMKSVLGNKAIQFKTPLTGEFQLKNAGLAVATALLIKKEGCKKISTASISQGLKRVKWPGRFEIVSQKPYIVLDGAHNGDSMKSLVRSIKKIFPKYCVIPILSVSWGKDVAVIAKELSGVSERVILTETEHSRSYEVGDLLEQVAPYFKRIEIASSVEKAIQLARISMQPKEILLITGSLFLVGEARTLSQLT